MRHSSIPFLGFLFAGSFLCSVTAQNLIVNPSLEAYSDSACLTQPQSDGKNVVTVFTSIHCATGWQLTRGLPDYVNLSAQDRGKRHPIPKSGKAMVGLLTTSGTNSGFEAAEVLLKEPLKEGVNYRASMFVHQDLLHYPTPIDGLGMLFTETPMSDELEGKKGMEAVRETMKFQPQVIQPTGKDLRCKDKWIEIYGEFKATGGERYLTIGCFRFSEEALAHRTYYYFDDLSLIALDDPTTAVDALMDGAKKVKLNNVFFNSGSATLSAKSNEELIMLADVLKAHPTLRIEIAGHTDNVGSEMANLQLSTQRAQNVKKQLEALGVNEEQLVSKGYGDRDPITSNKSEEGRAQNRRIEVIVLP